MAKTGGIIVPIISTFDKKGFDSAESGMQKLAAAAKVALVAAAAFAVKVGVDGVKAAIEDEAAQARLATSLKNTTGATDAQVAAVEAQILQMSLATGVADDELRPAFDRLARATSDTAQSTDLLKLAMDISAGTGKSLESVTSALAKSYEGSNTSLLKLGTGLDASSLKTMSFDEVVAQLGETFEGQAATQADTFEGKLARLNVAFDEAKETIGAALLPALTDMMDFVMDTAIPGIESFIGWLDDNKESLLLLAGAVAGLTLVLKLQAIQQAITGGIIKAQIALQAAYNAVMAANPIALVVIALAALAAAFVYAWNNSKQFRDIVIAVGKAGVNAFAFIIEVVGKFAETLLTVYSGPLRLFLKALAAVGVTPAAEALEFIENGIDSVGNFFDATADKVRGFNDTLDGLANKQIEFFGSSAEEATKTADTVAAASSKETDAVATATGAIGGSLGERTKAVKSYTESVEDYNDRAEAAWVSQTKAIKEATDAARAASWETATALRMEAEKFDPNDPTQSADYWAAQEKLGDFRVQQTLAGVWNNRPMSQEEWDAILSTASEAYRNEIIQSGLTPAGGIVNITVNGALDPEAVARQINDIMNNSAARSGNYVGIGSYNYALASA